METKEEISDTDSGIILHSGPDSPCTVMKDVTTHTRAVRVKLESLEERLEACVLELKKLCIREAELTGQLSPDYPLLSGEKPPQVRRRIGAAFKLDDQSLLKTEASALSAVEAELALQQQIVVAARRLCQEGALSKAVKRSRQQQCRLEEKKLKQLQEAVFQLRLQHGRTSPHPAMAGKRDHGVSDDSSLSDSAVLDDEDRTNPASQSSLEPPPPEAKTVSGPYPHLQDHDLRHTPSTTHQTHTYTHTHNPPRTLILRVPSAQHTHHPLSPSPGHTHNLLASPTRSPSLRHTHIMTNALPSPSLSHTHIMTNALPSPSLSHTHIMTSPLASPSLSHTHILTTPLHSPSLSHTHVSLSPSPSLSPSVSSSLGGGGSVAADDDERPPIEHSPWSESSLDKPYEKNKKHRSSSRRSTSPAMTPTLPPLEVCVGEAGRPLPLPLPLGLKPTQTCSAPCTPEMQLRRGLSLRLLSSDDGYSVDQERGRLSRRRVTDLGMSPECSPLYAGVGNPMYHSSSEDSASEHSSTSYTSGRHREDPCQSPAAADMPCLRTPEYGHHSPYGRPSNDPYARPSNDPYARPSNDPYGRPSNDPYARPSNDPYAHPYAHPSDDPYAHPSDDPYSPPSNDPYSRPSNDPYGRPSVAPSSPMSNGFYRNPQHQSTPSFSRAACPTGRTRAHLSEAELGLGLASGRYDYRFEEAALAVPAHVRLSRAPSLREYPRLHPAYGLPREVVSDQLKSWHQRQQFHRPRPRSLDRHRQGAVRIRNTASRESPLSQQPRRLDQPPQVERNCGPWTTEDDAHIISQV